MIIKGVGIGRGVAVGPVIRMAQPLPEPSDAPRAEGIAAESEIARVEKSLALVNADLNRRAEEAANGDEGAKQAAPILQAIAMFASDPSLAESIKGLVQQGKTAERAVLEGFAAVEDMFRAIGGYQAERAADLHDVGQRVIADLMGAPAPGLPVSETPFVLVAEDLSPADTAALDMSKTLAIVTSQGGPTSHTAILARARGIVAVVSAAEAAELENGTNVIVNAAKGEIVVNPSEDEIAAAEAAKSRAAAAKELRGKPGATKDGYHIPLLANVGKPSDGKTALEYGAEGVGLFRSEFLFMDSAELPSEEEQFNAYRKVASALKGAPVIIRTLDVGGDKEIPYLHMVKEDNPFMGFRAVRYCLANPDQYKVQLRALLRASAFGDVKIMIPLVTCVEEVVAVKELVEQCKTELTEEGRKFNENIEVGIMVETPAASLLADRLAEVADFFSIGTNDLIGYTMCADRGNDTISNLYQVYYPAVLRSLKNIIESGVKAGIMVGMCGEAAADPLLEPLLISWGLEEFSMSAPSILRARKTISQWTKAECDELAEKALACNTAAEVKALLESAAR